MLWPLAPAMAMVFIDFTIVSISATTIQRDVHLTETGVQWLICQLFMRAGRQEGIE